MYADRSASSRAPADARPQTGRPPAPAPRADPERALRVGSVAVAAALSGYTAATILLPATRVSVASAELRVAIEVSRVSVVAFAALVLALPYRQRLDAARNAFVAALAVIAFSNAVFGVLPYLGPSQPDPSLAAAAESADAAFYPWLASRYLAGLLFVCAGLQWPRIGIRRYLVGSLAVLVGIDAFLWLIAARLPVPFTIAPGSGEVVLSAGALWWHAALEAVPLILFAWGARLAGRLYLRSGAPLELWLALALVAGVFTQVHETLYPAILGPIVTSADLLRVAGTVLLLVGAALQVRSLSRDRALALELQREDLARQEGLLRALNAYAEREEAFRSVVTHELATPVATVRAFSHVLRSAPRSPAADAALDGILAEARRLDELIARLDELRALESDRFACDLRPVRVLPLLSEAAHFGQALPGGHIVRLDAADLRVRADPVRLGQALRNVIANAARYSPDRTTLTISGRADDDAYVVTIEDEGPGIDPDEVDLILERFTRGRAAAGTEGTGLGLYVTRQIVEAHGGSLAVEHVAPRGARVLLRLQRAT